MIIKSMSRKSRSFSQLYHYMKKGSSRSSQYDFFAQNIYARKDKDIIAEFSANAHRLKARRNGNYLFHEIISITKSSQLTLEQEKQRLFDIVQHYAQMRCKYNLVAGYLHDEKSNNVHFHLMISSNEIDSPTNQRLTKYEFDRVKKATEKYVIETYPELEQDILINATREQRKQKQSNKAGEVKRKGGRLEKKEKITQTLREIFAQSRSMSELFNNLSEQGIEMYNRGNTIGFITLGDGKKYRLKTLGLEDAFRQVEALSTRQTNRRAEKPPSSSQQSTEHEPVKHDDEVERRKAEIKSHRSKKANRGDKQNDNDFER
ncbi:relaxase/mobilization nuclease domain-containing protein [Pseudoalteromonas rubra]|uniref:Relaxase n=1 Tax=Pseudoalteromonas rubra TaxID=43658 RepID=A0A0F4QIC3_9GAMM|nr:relaxase/mobilization nuclease domain-containing protein [Pseudoalteromonas rubra]KJZ07069.1 hypothetical protein TW77_16415 [Pseudoalteromonas rubra]